jgi:hypothetical protein
LGLNPQELTRLETKLLKTLGYDLYISEEEYSYFCRGVQFLAREWNQLRALKIQQQQVVQAALYNAHAVLRSQYGILSPVETQNPPLNYCNISSQSRTELLIPPGAPRLSNAPLPQVQNSAMLNTHSEFAIVVESILSLSGTYIHSQKQDAPQQSLESVGPSVMNPLKETCKKRSLKRPAALDLHPIETKRVELPTQIPQQITPALTISSTDDTSPSSSSSLPPSNFSLTSILALQTPVSARQKSVVLEPPVVLERRPTDPNLYSLKSLSKIDL